MDATFINPVLESIVNVLVTMADMQPQAGKPSIKTDTSAQGVVTGIIDLRGPQLSGSVAISLSKAVALDLARRMLRLETEEVDEMVQDLVGELANMMGGGAKARLEELGYDFDLTLPSVVAGKGHTVEHSIQAPVILLPFHVEAGEFFVEVCFPGKNT